LLSDIFEPFSTLPGAILAPLSIPEQAVANGIESPNTQKKLARDYWGGEMGRWGAETGTVVNTTLFSETRIRSFECDGTLSWA
jgi:hypothetical protein